MSQGKVATVRLQTLDGDWEVGGVDRKRGIMPTDMVLTSNQWGSDTAGFVLRRDPRVPWPDLRADTPIEVEIGGIVVWSGFIQETPGRHGTDPAITVQPLGWQHHLDDNLFERTYVHTNPGDYRDMRSPLEADLTKLTTAGQVQSGDGVITLSWAKDSTVPAGSVVGCFIDVGPLSPGLRRVVVEWDSSANAAGAGFFVRMADGPDWPNPVAGYEDPVFNLPVSTTGNTSSGTATDPHRYVGVFMYTSAALAPTDDIWVKVKAIRLFGDPSWESGGVSVLRPPTVINDALDRCTQQLAADRSLIVPDSSIAFYLPALAFTDPTNARDAWNAVNVYYDYQSKIDAQRRAIFRPRPTRPRFEVGAWSPMEDEDTSGASASEIYDQVLVIGTDDRGQPVRILRTQTGTLVDRRGRHRTYPLQVAPALPADGIAYSKIGDIWLAAHRSTPFKGTVTAVGGRAVRDRVSGTKIEPERLLLETDELLHFTDRVDPDTGRQGRDARLTQVSYELAKDQATITLDNSRANIDALLQRLGLVTGAGA